MLAYSLITFLSSGPKEGEISGKGSKHGFSLSRQMSLLRAATTTRIDESRSSPVNLTAIR